MQLDLPETSTPNLRFLLTSIASVPGLDRLYLVALGGMSTLTSRLEQLRILHLLPSTLRHLCSTDWMYLSAPYLLAAFSDKSCLLAIQEIELSCKLVDEGGDGCLRPVDELEQIRGAADARKIKVIW